VTLEFDAVRADSWATHTVDLVPGESGTYDIVGSRYELDTPITITGTYEIIGPNESESGSFSIFMPDSSSVRYTGVHTRYYPEEMHLFGDASFKWSGATDPTLFDTIIDGERVTAGMSSLSVSVSGPYLHPYVPSVVPEPSSLVLLLVPMALILTMRRTRRI
jgi:hypothetical protein